MVRKEENAHESVDEVDDRLLLDKGACSKFFGAPAFVLGRRHGKICNTSED